MDIAESYDRAMKAKLAGVAALRHDNRGGRHGDDDDDDDDDSDGFGEGLDSSSMGGYAELGSGGGLTLIAPCEVRQKDVMMMLYSIIVPLFLEMDKLSHVVFLGLSSYRIQSLFLLV